MPTDDRTTRAKIRDAAIWEIAERPAGSPTVRDIATAAGVSPGSVIHHYGTMDGLHQACNDHVAAVIRMYKSEAVSQSQGFDILSTLRGISDLPLAGYLAKAALRDSSMAAQLIDELVDDAVLYTQEGVEAGTIRPSDVPRGRATILLLWSLGGLLLHDHLERLLGFDITDPDALASPSAEAYMRPAVELMSYGILTDSYAKQMDEALDAAYGATSHDSEHQDPKGTT